MIAIGYILLALGVIASLAGEIMFLVVARGRGILWFLGCLLIPVVAWVFFFLNVKATIKPLGLQVFGLLLVGAGCSLAGVVWHGA